MEYLVAAYTDTGIKKKRIRTVSVSAVPLLQGLAKLYSPWYAMVWGPEKR